MLPHETDNRLTVAEGLNDGLSETPPSSSATDSVMEQTTFPKHAVPIIQGGSPSLHVFNAIDHCSLASSKLDAQ
jgi:hypothetical protein